MADELKDPTAPKRPPSPPEGDIRVVDRRWWAQSEAAGADAPEASTKPAYVEELEQRLAAKDEELRTTIARYREASEEFDRTRVRVRRDVAKEVERGRRAILVDLLDVLDNLDRAVDAARTGVMDPALLQGIEMVRGQFLSKLQGHGVRAIETMNHAFDPVLHEAATTVPVADPDADGRVLGVIRQGYAIGDDVLRPAVVAVARFTPEGAQS